MTDIDAICKRDAALLIEPDDWVAHRYLSDVEQCQRDRRALRTAYDAKCEELAHSNATSANAFRLSQERAKAAEAERDAAVREREGLRKALNDYGTHGQYCASRRGTAVIGGETEWGPCTCGYEAALAPPTEQPKVSEREVLP